MAFLKLEQGYFTGWFWFFGFWVFFVSLFFPLGRTGHGTELQRVTQSPYLGSDAGRLAGVTEEFEPSL